MANGLSGFANEAYMPLADKPLHRPLNLLMQGRQKQIQPANLRLRAVGAAVRQFREQAGRSQERLSADCGFDRTYISRVERGIINPTVSRLWSIADALQLPLSQLTGRMERWVAERQTPSKLTSDTKRS